MQQPFLSQKYCSFHFITQRKQMTYAKYRKVPANLLIHASKPSRTQAFRLGLNWQIFKVVWFNDYIHENITGSFTMFFGKIRCFYRFHAFPRGSDQMSTSVCIQWGYLLHNMWKRGTITACSIFKSYHDTSSTLIYWERRFGTKWFRIGSVESGRFLSNRPDSWWVYRIRWKKIQDLPWAQFM